MDCILVYYTFIEILAKKIVVIPNNSTITLNLVEVHILGIFEDKRKGFRVKGIQQCTGH